MLAMDLCTKEFAEDRNDETSVFGEGVASVLSLIFGSSKPNLHNPFASDTWHRPVSPLLHVIGKVLIRLWLDSFFVSILLAHVLRYEANIFVSGTMMANRVGIPPEIQEWKPDQVGDFHVVYRSDGSMAIFKWRDYNKVLLLLTTCVPEGVNLPPHLLEEAAQAEAAAQKFVWRWVKGQSVSRAVAQRTRVSTQLVFVHLPLDRSVSRSLHRALLAYFAVA